MTLPVNRWEPTTDKYKSIAAQGADAQAELAQRLRDLHGSKLRRPWKQEKAPLWIRIFIWYYFGRAVLWGLLLFALTASPQSLPSTWFSSHMSRALHMPENRRARETRTKKIEKATQAYSAAGGALLAGTAGRGEETPRSVTIAFVAFRLILSAVVWFLWWNRSWKIRWITMFYSGGLVVLVAMNLLAGAVSGAGAGIDLTKAPLLLVTLGINGVIFLYLAFGYGVKEWFEPES